MTRTNRIIRGILALAVVVGIVVVAPFILVRVGRLDALSLLFSWQAGYGTDVLLGMVTLIAWLAWLLATISFFSELISALRGVSLRAPGIGIFAPASAVLVTAILGLLASGAATQSTLPWQAEQPDSVSMASSADVASSADEEDSIGLSAASGASERDFKVHTVQPGEDLWSLAERYLEDGFAWRKIAQVNDTTLLDPTAPLQPGTQLFIPMVGLEGGGGAGPLTNQNQSSAFPAERADVLPSEAQQVDAADTQRLVEVQPGDTLWGIAERELGEAESWQRIADANSDLISDPDVIDVGWQLKIPGTAAVADPPSVDDGVAEDSRDETPQRTGSKREHTTLEDDAGDRSPAVVAGPGEVGPAEQREVERRQSQDQPPHDQADSDRAADENADADANTDGPDMDSVVASVLSVAGISVTLAATIVAALRLRRGRQLAQLPVGRRLRLPSGSDGLVNSALVALSDQDAYWSPSAPRSLQANPSDLSVRLGEVADTPVQYDLRIGGVTGLVGTWEESLGLATAVILQLIGEEDPVRVIAAGSGFDWLVSLDEPRLEIASAREGGQQLEKMLGARESVQVGSDKVDLLQRDPQTAEAWAPTLFVFDSMPELNGIDPNELRDCGIAVLICATADEFAGGGLPTALVHVEELEARLPDGTYFVPDHVSAPARRALKELFDSASEVEFEVADWWAEQPASDATNVVPISAGLNTAPAPLFDAGSPQRLEQHLPSASQSPPLDPIQPEQTEHPFLKLLGPVELVGARGVRPPRALKQCAEYCAWLMEHPGASAPQMTRSLLVAESTRRSNMSRLRTWLGSDDQDAPYLPEAYSGRIHLHPAISSDWEQFGLLLAAGVNRASDEALRAALGMVRGAPLADAAPGQWHWAEQMRADMSAMIRDAAYVLASRELAAGDYDAARWAANRGLLAAPEDEQILGVKLLIEHRSGNRTEVDRLVLHITRQARILGVDLMDETVTLLQEVVEGQARSRAVL